MASEWQFYRLGVGVLVGCVELELTDLNYIFVYADDSPFFFFSPPVNINTKYESFLHAGKEIGLEVNVDKNFA
jgi:hypothetical protein